MWYKELQNPEQFVDDTAQVFKIIRALTGNSFDLRAKVVVNCAGPWAASMLSDLPLAVQRTVIEIIIADADRKPLYVFADDPGPNAIAGHRFGGASVSDIVSGGRTLWRLRVAANDHGSATELASRIASLGFGRPQIVKD